MTAISLSFPKICLQAINDLVVAQRYAMSDPYLPFSGELPDISSADRASAATAKLRVMLEDRQHAIYDYVTMDRGMMSVPNTALDWPVIEFSPSVTPNFTQRLVDPAWTSLFRTFTFKNDPCDKAWSSHRALHFVESASVTIVASRPLIAGSLQSSAPFSQTIDAISFDLVHNGDARTVGIDGAVSSWRHEKFSGPSWAGICRPAYDDEIVRSKCAAEAAERGLSNAWTQVAV